MREDPKEGIIERYLLSITCIIQYFHPVNTTAEIVIFMQQDTCAIYFPKFFALQKLTNNVTTIPLFYSFRSLLQSSLMLLLMLITFFNFEDYCPIERLLLHYSFLINKTLREHFSRYPSHK